MHNDKILALEFTPQGNQLAEMDAKGPRESEEHGWVWLFLRMPVEVKAGKQKALAS